jgi:hypothetical protein
VNTRTVANGRTVTCVTQPERTVAPSRCGPTHSHHRIRFAYPTAYTTDAKIYIPYSGQSCRANLEFTINTKSYKVHALKRLSIFVVVAFDTYLLLHHSALITLVFKSSLLFVRIYEYVMLKSSNSCDLFGHSLTSRESLTSRGPLGGLPPFENLTSRGQLGGLPPFVSTLIGTIVKVFPPQVPFSRRDVDGDLSCFAFLSNRRGGTFAGVSLSAKFRPTLPAVHCLDRKCSLGHPPLLEAFHCC